jgi:predicted nucleic acid-binding protein
MPGSFFDSNVLLYVVSDDPAKADLAEGHILQGGTISVQVLNEVTNVARRKMRLSWPEAHQLLSSIRSLLTIQPITLATHDLGLGLAERHGFSVYDAMIVAAALQADCETLLSEDMHHGMLVDGRLRILNPFRDYA